MSSFISGGGGRRRAVLAVPAALVVLVTALGASGCSSGSPAGKPARTAPSPASSAYRRWGLDAPLAAPPAPPARKLTDGMKPGDAPKVVRRVETADKVVFLTFDDGAEKDPEFVRMAEDLKLPFTMFLTDAIARTGRGYGYFEQLRDGGNTVQNHTLSHPDLRTLGPDAQRREICGQQDVLAERFGVRPWLFRPPYGDYDDATLAAAGGCGVKAVVLWEETMQINDMRYAQGGALRPGDIVLAHFRGPSELKGTTMTRMVSNMLRSVQRQGFTVARLEDYV
ncbi:polysaccharide deacetylase family protein [Streptomyces sp. UNOC14_S4]|uniref:polysaccharide deacetylase family protein n=1 Tax=Streptomyces sp. UNOC14_S4 TaxID=2872340 RepID=UPI001E58C2A5|nr:polysaccharide deacetylase family protein [Streptomyces sp. UNOC14_S4]MCC3769427.1 polysaccharide deacetylase family protein [Streptomyces sp. UNOC14_S4]